MEKLIQKYHRKNSNNRKNAITFRKKNFDNKKKRIYVS